MLRYVCACLGVVLLPTFLFGQVAAQQDSYIPPDYPGALLSELAGIEAWGQRKLGHFQAPGWGSGLRLAFLLSKLLDQQSWICSAEVSSSGGGWKG